VCNGSEECTALLAPPAAALWSEIFAPASPEHPALNAQEAPAAL
jgi:hypothetical protein